ncbi:MAG: hypothetical protein KDD70_18150, partial [Bdellovibrionales bacterium]|nr:hypothetical protein [Bdellovibrionales bacterium]
MINLDKVPSDSNESICPTRPSSFQKEVSDELESLRTLCLEEPVLAQHSIDFSMRHKLTTEEGSAEGPIIPPWTILFEKNLFEDREHSIAGNFIAATDLLQIKELAETYRTAVTTANAVFDKIKAVLTTDPEQRPDHSEPVIVSTVSASIDPKILSEGEKGKLERELIGNRCAKFLTEEAPTPPQLLAVMRVFRGLPIPGRGGVVPELTRIAAEFSTNREMDLPLLFTTLAQWSGQSAEIASQIRERITELFPGSKPVTSLSYEDFL